MNKIFTFLILSLLVIFSSSSSAQTTIVEQNFDAASSWSYSSDVTFFDNGWGSGFFGIIDFNSANPLEFGSLSSNILGENDLNDSPDGTSGFATITFASTNISNFTNVVVSFDYDIEGYNANTDEVFYELFYDGSGQGNVVLQTGSTAGDDAQGSVSANIPGGTNAVELQLKIRNNGGSGYSGFDNFKLEGTPASTDTNVSFIDATSTLTEGGAFIDICVNIFNPDGSNATTVEVALDGVSTATNGTDYDNGGGTPAAITFPQTLTFPAGSSTNQCLTIFISNDDTVEEANETVILNLQNPSGGTNATLGSTIQHTLTITDNDFPPIIISRIADPVDDFEARFIELRNVGSNDVTLNGWKVVKYVNNNPAPNNISIPDGTIIAAGEYYTIASSSAVFNSSYGCAPNQANTNANSNGDDSYELSDGSTTIDLYGEIGTDGTGQPWEYADAIVFRNSGVTAGQSTWMASEWTFIDPGNTTNAAPSACILPIELTSFTATANNSTTLLQWQTASEINNDYMSIEASTDGINFKEVGRVKGAGTTNQAQEYRLVDETPSQGLNYYRLLQVDYDGTSAYSKIVTVNFRTNNDQIAIYPNPTTDVLTVKFPTFWEGETTMTVTNALGQVVKIIDYNEDTISVENLPNGFYLLTIENGNQTVTKRFQKN